MKKRTLWAVLVALGVAALVVYVSDQVMKWWVISHLPEGQPVHVIGDLLIFQFVRNPGAAFSLASGSTWVFSLLAVAVIIVLIIFARRLKSLLWAVVFGLLLGGTLGNLTDRLTKPPAFGAGHVIDFIYMPWMMPAIFNIADIAISTSAVMFVVLILLGINFDGSRERRKKAAGAGSQTDGA